MILGLIEAAEANVERTKQEKNKESWTDFALCKNCKHCNKTKKSKTGYVCEIQFCGSGNEKKPVALDTYCASFEERLTKEEMLVPTENLKKVSVKVLSYQVCQMLAAKMRREPTELVVSFLKQNYSIHSIRQDDKSEMWIYKDGIYVPSGKSYIKEVCRNILKMAFTGSLCNEIIIKIEADTFIEQNDFFNSKNIDEIAVNNGILNLFSRKLEPFTPEKKFFNKIPIDYTPGADCPNIEEHFGTVLKSKEDIPILYEIFGFLLLKEYKFEKAFMFTGSGRNGKSKTLELMKHFIGHDNCANVPLQQLEKDLFSVSELFNKMANLSGDIDSSALKSTGMFKNLTGRDIVSAPRKFMTRVTFQNYAKMIFCANQLPVTYDITPAFWNRWVLLEFPYTFVSKKVFDSTPIKERALYRIKNPEIIQKLTSPGEMQGLLNNALDGLLRLLENKDFSNSKSVEEIKNMWIRKSDSFSAFCMDYVVGEYGKRVTKKELRFFYNQYCLKYKIKPVTDKAIKYTLGTVYGSSEDRHMINGKQEPCWYGIKIISEGSKDSNGISNRIGILNSLVTSNTPSTSTTLTNPLVKEVELVQQKI